MALPTGAIIAYAGDEYALPVGWYLCNGKDGTPDLRGRFICGSPTPWEVSRTKYFSTATKWTEPGGKTMDITVTVPHIPKMGQKVAQDFKNEEMVLWNDDALTFQVYGSDKETRPKNMALNFLMKKDDNATIPVGAVIPLAAAEGNTTPAEMKPWMVCDGGKESKNDWEALYSVLGTRYNAQYLTDKDNVYKPDLRGLFVRGVNHNSSADPDAALRRAPDGTMNAYYVGTLQGFATYVKRWMVSIPHFPKTWYDKEDDTLKEGNPNTIKTDRITGPRNVRCRDFQSKQHWSGFAKETRPDNAAVNYYIAAKATTMDGKHPIRAPVSTIIAMVGPLSNPEWLLRNGQKVSRAEYPELCSKISLAWGGVKDLDCFLPDLRGRFLRGADGRDPRVDTGTVDPDRFKRWRAGIVPESDRIFPTWGAGSLQGYATGIPESWRSAPGQKLTIDTVSDVTVEGVDLEPSINDHGETGEVSTGIAANVPTSRITNENILASKYGPVSRWNEGSLTSVTSGPSGESVTAPERMFVNFYIKAKE